MEFKANLLLVQHLVSKHLQVEFNNEGCFVLTSSREEVAIIEEVNNLYYIKFFKVHVVESVVLAHSKLKEDKLTL